MMIRRCIITPCAGKTSQQTPQEWCRSSGFRPSFLLGFLLLLHFAPPALAALGGLVFAVHPLHVEAVANVVGRGELLAAIFVLTACLVHLKEPGGTAWRGSRWAGLVVLYIAGLGSKEMAVTLPGLLVLLTCAQIGWSKGLMKSAREWPLYVLFTSALGTYLVVRGYVLGSVLGELPAPYLGDLSTAQRLLTAVSVWPEYLRLLVFPLDLVVEYGPAVLLPARSIDPDVLLGALVGACTILVAVRFWKSAPLVTIGVAWFALAILPVSNLPFPVGVLLAERTLYLPSLGLSFALTGVAVWLVGNRPRSVKAFAILISTALVLLSARTVSRNPAWMSTFISAERRFRNADMMVIGSQPINTIRENPLYLGCLTYSGWSTYGCLNSRSM